MNETEREKKIEDYLHLYLGCDCVCGKQKWKLTGISKNEIINTATFEPIDSAQDWFVTNDLSTIKPLLVPFEKITEDYLMELWGVIGGAWHLFEFAKDEFKTSLIQGYWDDGFQMDYYTMSCLINKCREIGYDMDDLINSGLAIDAVTLTKTS